MKTSKNLVRMYMREAVSDHVDYRTNEVNYTLLAEDAAHHFEDYEDDGEISQDYFDLALDIGKEKEDELNEI